MHNKEIKSGDYYSDSKRVVELIINIYESNFVSGESKHDYYCGITNNIEDNLKKHNIKNHLVVCKCQDAKIAAEAEDSLGKAGFDIGDVNHGGNGGAEDSVYVYMFKKSDRKV